MQITKPYWVSHDGMPIFSVDVHPDNSRFVTGGQGKDSGLVIIWNLTPVVSQEIELDENMPKMLCQIDGHLACVNCVRWSKSGKYLASSGDDKLVMIWKLINYGANVCFGSKCNTETWRCISTLRGHSGDILDMAWSPEDIWLATGSVDNTIIVWDATKLSTIVTVLKGHTGMVKGVTWDPIGKYLSSQSEDKSLKIWRTIDWKLEKVIKKPFENCSGTTAVLRHSWSPDGQFLITAHAMNQTGPTSQIIERDGWKYDKDYVGHRKAITCAKFSDNIVKKKTSNALTPMCVCALGSRDSSLSVWMTGLTRPIVVIEDAFEGPVLDISWSPNGKHLFACSFDGSVIAMIFDESEIGTSITDEERDQFLEKMYGTSSIGIHRKEGAHFVENPDMLPLLEESDYRKEEKREQKQQQYINKTGLVSSGKRLTPARVIQTQIETRTADGKRRITPIYIPPIVDEPELLNEKDSATKESDNIFAKGDSEELSQTATFRKPASDKEDAGEASKATNRQTSCHQHNPNGDNQQNTNDQSASDNDDARKNVTPGNNRAAECNENPNPGSEKPNDLNRPSCSGGSVSVEAISKDGTRSGGHDLSSEGGGKKTLSSILKLGEKSSSSITITPIYNTDNGSVGASNIDTGGKADEKLCTASVLKRKISRDDSPISITPASAEKKPKYSDKNESKPDGVPSRRQEDSHQQQPATTTTIDDQMEAQFHSVLERTERSSDSANNASRITPNIASEIKVSKSFVSNTMETAAAPSSADGSGNSAAADASDYKKLPSTGCGNFNTYYVKSSTPEKLKIAIRKPSNAAINLLAAKQPKFMEKMETSSRPDAKSNETTRSFLSNNISLPKSRLTIPTHITIADKYKLLVSSEAGFNINSKFCRVKLMRDNNLLWEYAYGCEIIGCTFNESAVAIALANRNVYLIQTKTGRLVSPPIILTAPVSVMLMNAVYFVCVTCDGVFNMWNVREMKYVITGQSLASILTSSSSNAEEVIKKITLSEDGIPMLLLSSGKSFLFDARLNAWALAGDNSDPVMLCSLQRVRQNNIRATFAMPNNKQLLPLYTLQSYSSSIAGNRLTQNNSEISDVCTMTFLEQQIAASIALKSAQEFKYWLLTLVRFLVQQGKLQRLRSICEELLGPVHQCSESTSSSVLGLRKHSLLKDVLKEIGTNIHMQRLFTEFNDQLNSKSSQ